MTFVYRKHYKIIYIIFFLFILNNCQLKDPDKIHGINFLENREKTLKIGSTNKNDVLKLIGNPHTKSISNENTWVYYQRTLTRGKLVNLGQNVLKENNVLKLEFDKYGILKNKKIINKNDMNKISYIKTETKNQVSQKSFLGKFLSSVTQKMYGKKKK
jgi:outer membrane protein assembly factor BamE (lipoprotein component of BamABCDE complex)